MTTDNLLILLDIQAHPGSSGLNYPDKFHQSRTAGPDLSVLQGFIFQTRSGWEVRTGILTCVEVEGGIVQDNLP